MNGETFIMYTTEQGGIFKAQFQKTTPEEYEKIRSAGELERFDYVAERMVVERLAFVALVRVEKNFDFRLGKSRG